MHRWSKTVAWRILVATWVLSIISRGTVFGGGGAPGIACAVVFWASAAGILVLGLVRLLNRLDGRTAAVVGLTLFAVAAFVTGVLAPEGVLDSMSRAVLLVCLIVVGAVLIISRPPEGGRRMIGRSADGPR
jgi:peptidoglycan/LPS O-acetylase OafA/YrhL